jgi:hypothetical protein
MRADEPELTGSTQHGSAIEALARETGREPAQVKELYERELAQLEATAKVRGFINLLVSRKVRKALRESSAQRNSPY